MNHDLIVVEVAQMYFPDSDARNALRRFRYMLKRTPQLWTTLCKLGYHSHQRVFTPLQMQAIIDELGDPA